MSTYTLIKAPTKMENDKPKEIRVRTTKYKNAISYKFSNRRTTVGQNEHGFFFQFSIATDDERPRVIHKRFKNKVTLTEICLTNEAAIVLFNALADQLGIKTKQL